MMCAKENPYDEKKAELYRQKFTDLMIAAGKIKAPEQRRRVKRQ